MSQNNWNNSKQENQDWKKDRAAWQQAEWNNANPDQNQNRQNPKNPNQQNPNQPNRDPNKQGQIDTDS